MSKGLQWVIGIMVVLVALSIVAANVWPMFAYGAGWSAAEGFRAMPHMRGGLPFGHMAGFGRMGLGMLFWPVVILGLLALGVFALTRGGRPAVPPPPPPPPAAAAPCAHCGQPLQAGWKACPHCGEKIA